MATMPKFDPQRRRSAKPTTELPAEGRDGPPPRWPLAGKLSQVEQIVWRELWASPQAVVWERMGAGTIRIVARYCRIVVEAEKPEPMGTVMRAAVELENALGLNPKSMRMMLWQIVEAETAPVKQLSSARVRIRAVDQEGK